MKFYAALIVLAVALCVAGIWQVNRAHDRHEEIREMAMLVKVTEYEVKK